MADTRKQGLLDRIEEKAREATPLWQWLVSIALVFLPIYLGFAYAEHIEQVSGRLYKSDIYTILFFQAVGSMGFLFLGIRDLENGYWRRLLRFPDPKEQPPGPFRLGADLVGVFYRPWWIPPMTVGMGYIIRIMESGEPAIYADEVFWQGREGFEILFAAVLCVFAAEFLAGLFIWQKLREQGG